MLGPGRPWAQLISPGRSSSHRATPLCPQQLGSPHRVSWAPIINVTHWQQDTCAKQPPTQLTFLSVPQVPASPRLPPPVEVTPWNSRGELCPRRAAQPCCHCQRQEGQNRTATWATQPAAGLGSRSGSENSSSSLMKCTKCWSTKQSNVYKGKDHLPWLLLYDTLTSILVQSLKNRSPYLWISSKSWNKPMGLFPHLSALHF